MKYVSRPASSAVSFCNVAARILASIVYSSCSRALFFVLETLTTSTSCRCNTHYKPLGPMSTGVCHRITRQVDVIDCDKNDSRLSYPTTPSFLTATSIVGGQRFGRLLLQELPAGYFPRPSTVPTTTAPDKVRIVVSPETNAGANLVECIKSIKDAIHRGVPMWNSGDQAGCTTVYRGVCTKYATIDPRLAKAVRLELGTPPEQGGSILRNAMNEFLFLVDTPSQAGAGAQRGSTRKEPVFAGMSALSGALTKLPDFPERNDISGKVADVQLESIREPPVGWDVTTSGNILKMTNVDGNKVRLEIFVCVLLFLPLEDITTS